MIIGDDIVIKGKQLSDSYKRIMDNLEIGYTDEFSSTKGNSVAEFAKRLFRNGQELSPVPSRQLNHGFLAEIQYINVAIDRGQALPEFDSIRYPWDENKFRSIIMSTYFFRVLKGSVSVPGRHESDVSMKLHDAIYKLADDEMGSAQDLIYANQMNDPTTVREKCIRYFLKLLLTSNKSIKPYSSK